MTTNWQVMVSPCGFIAASAGVANFVVTTAVDANHDVPQNLGAVDGRKYGYSADNPNNDQWETGTGTWHASTLTLSRDTIAAVSSGDATPCNFSSPPIVIMFPAGPESLAPGGSGFMAGTMMLFQQSAAPVGWVKQTTHNDKALRVVSGTAGAGGNNSFSSTFAYRTSDGTTLTVAQMPSHSHPAAQSGGKMLDFTFGFGDVQQTSSGSYFVNYETSTGSQGGGTSHTHTYDMTVQYVDLIICQKS